MELEEPREAVKSKRIQGNLYALGMLDKEDSWGHSRKGKHMGHS